MSSAFFHDGTTFDLNRIYVDVIGCEWKWNGRHNSAGEPMMQSRETVLSLPDLYRDHGPLIVVGVRRSTGSEIRAALDINFAASKAAGHVEADPDTWASRIARLTGRAQ